ncbi:hypothetical protein C4F51_08590 [Cellvibrio sp. KB43]|uniref:Uncharacterized protein n=1 Tax=Cellvibrio polysaccharolyticus TaxID=2082724 RepID=A0A928V5Y4_9GAMM|nr:hypothetical protein [Cellvibrio polysaccharolyticus]
MSGIDVIKKRLASESFIYFFPDGAKVLAKKKEMNLTAIKNRPQEPVPVIKQYLDYSRGYFKTH